MRFDPLVDGITTKSDSDDSNAAYCVSSSTVHPQWPYLAITGIEVAVVQPHCMLQASPCMECRLPADGSRGIYLSTPSSVPGQGL